MPAAPGYDNRSIQSAAVQNIIAGKAANAQKLSSQADMLRAETASGLAPFQKAASVVGGIKDLVSSGTNLWQTYYNTQATEAATEQARFKLEMDKLTAPSEVLKAELGSLGLILKMMRDGQVTPAGMKHMMRGRFKAIQAKFEKNDFPPYVKNTLQGFMRMIERQSEYKRYPLGHPSQGMIIPDKSTMLMQVIKSAGASQQWGSTLSDILAKKLREGPLQEAPHVDAAVAQMRKAMLDNVDTIAMGFPSTDDLRAFFKKMMTGHHYQMEPGEWDEYLNDIWEPSVIDAAKAHDLYKPVYDMYGWRNNLSSRGGGGITAQSKHASEMARVLALEHDTTTEGEINAAQDNGRMTLSDANAPGGNAARRLMLNARGGANVSPGNILFDGVANSKTGSKEGEHKSRLNAELGVKGQLPSAGHELKELVLGGPDIPYRGAMKYFPDGTVSAVNDFAGYYNYVVDPTSPGGLINLTLAFSSKKDFPFPGAMSFKERDDKSIEYPTMRVSKTKELFQPGSDAYNAQEKAQMAGQNIAMQYAYMTESNRYSSATAVRWLKEKFIEQAGENGEGRWSDVIEKLGRIRDHWGETTKQGVDGASEIDNQTYFVLDEFINAAYAPKNDYSVKPRGPKRRHLANAALTEWLRDPANHPEHLQGRIKKIEAMGDQLFVIAQQMVNKPKIVGGVVQGIEQVQATRHFPLEDFLASRNSGLGHGAAARAGLQSLESLLNPNAMENLTDEGFRGEVTVFGKMERQGAVQALWKRAKQLKKGDVMGYWDKALMAHYGDPAGLVEEPGSEKSFKLYDEWTAKLSGKMVENRLARGGVGSQYASAHEQEVANDMTRDYNVLTTDWRRAEGYWEIQSHLYHAGIQDKDGKSLIGLSNNERISLLLRAMQRQMEYGQIDGKNGLKATIDKLQKLGVSDVTMLQGHKEELRALHRQRFMAVPFWDQPDYWTIAGEHHIAPEFLRALQMGPRGVLGERKELDKDGKPLLYTGKKGFVSGEDFGAVGSAPAEAAIYAGQEKPIVSDGESLKKDREFLAAETKAYRMVWDFLHRAQNVNDPESRKGMAKLLGFEAPRPPGLTDTGKTDWYGAYGYKKEGEFDWMHRNAYVNAYRNRYFKDFEHLSEEMAYGSESPILEWEEKYWGQKDGPTKPRDKELQEKGVSDAWWNRVPVSPKGEVGRKETLGTIKEAIADDEELKAVAKKVAEGTPLKKEEVKRSFDIQKSLDRIKERLGPDVPSSSESTANKLEKQSYIDMLVEAQEGEGAPAAKAVGGAGGLEQLTGEAMGKKPGKLELIGPHEGISTEALEARLAQGRTGGTERLRYPAISREEEARLDRYFGLEGEGRTEPPAAGMLPSPHGPPPVLPDAPIRLHGEEEKQDALRQIERDSGLSPGVEPPGWPGLGPSKGLPSGMLGPPTEKEDARVKAYQADLEARFFAKERVSGSTRNELIGFEEFYKNWAERNGVSLDPDDPRHQYDYRGAYAAGFRPDEKGHWPSAFKGLGHPNRYVDGIDTIRGPGGSAGLIGNLTRGERDRETLRRYFGEMDEMPWIGDLIDKLHLSGNYVNVGPYSSGIQSGATMQDLWGALEKKFGAQAGPGGGSTIKSDAYERLLRQHLGF